MFDRAKAVADCVLHMHDPRLMIAAAAVCGIGIYASFALANHASRAAGRLRTAWGLVSVISSGCTAWATHFIVLLAFRPDIPAAFDPILTTVSLLLAILGIGTGVWISIRSRERPVKFAAGLVIGTGIAALHYVGQAAYLVRGNISWDIPLVAISVIIGLPLCGVAMVVASNRSLRLRRLSAPLLLFAIAVLHFCGMAAMTIRFDPSKVFPPNVMSPEAITPVVAGISLSLIALAVIGWRFDLAAFARLRQDRRRLRELADVALEGLLICQADTVVTANTSIEQLAGYAPGEMVGLRIDALFSNIDLTGLPEREERQADLIMAPGSTTPVRVLRAQMMLGHKTQTVIAVRDQRERLRTEARMHKLAFDDSLTGLSNRGSFVDQLRHLMDVDTPLALLSIDLDRFKAVNDQFGHLVGDEVLKMVASRIRSVVNAGDFVARAGGDEFAVILIGTDAASRARDVCAQIVASLEKPFPAGNIIAYCGGTVGVVLAPNDASTTAELRQCADLALYRAKETGRGSVCFYDEQMDTASRDRRTLETDLRAAIDSNAITLAYQPVVSAQTGEITSVEALARWCHPQRGPVSPEIFISLAEECGLIEALGATLLRQACLDAATWPSHIRVAVNLSPLQFQVGDLCSTVQNALEYSGLAAHRLQLEVTEGLLIRDVDRTFAELERLRALGIQILMDDFGVGYSSLSYFQRFPFDKVKIDKSFVDQITTSRAARAIVHAVVGLGEQLSMGVVAEGVETQEQMHLLIEAGCTHLQGYLFSRPLEKDEFDLQLNTSLKLVHESIS